MNTKPQNARLFAAILGALASGLLLPTPSAKAASNTWDGGTNGNWVTPANWVGDANVPGSTSVLSNTDAATFNNNVNTTITIDLNRNLRRLIFDGSAGAFTIGGAGVNGGNSLLLTTANQTFSNLHIASTLAGTGLTQTINAPLTLVASGGVTGAHFFVNDSADATNTLVVAGNVSAGTMSGLETLTLAGANTGNNRITGAIGNGGAGGGLAVVKANAGTWTLAGSNTYTGATTVNSSGGILVGVGAHAFGSTSGISLLGSNSVISFRGDSSTSFTKASDGSGIALTPQSSNATIDVRSDTGVTTAKTMTVGTLTLNAAITNNTNFTGADNTSLSVGAVSTGNSDSGSEVITNNIGGSGTLTLASFASNRTGTPTVTFTGSGNTAVTGAITEVAQLALTKNGAGTLTLSGENSYTGVTTVTLGTLLVNGTHSGGSANGYTVALGGILGGTGAITTASLTTAGGSKLTPGGTGIAEDLSITLASGAALMNISSSSNDSGAYLFDLAAPSASDKIVLTLGTLNIGTMTNADFVFTELAGFTNGTYVLFDASSPIAGSVTSAMDSIIFSGGRTGTLSLDTINNNVILTVVPEPSAVALLGLGVAVTLWRARSRRTV
jgi:autotransporter-associated beta strand protein